jgi:hypothetical protein
MESFTRINVSHHGKHFFRVEIASFPEFCKAQIDALKARFIEEDGFSIQVTYWSCTGRQVAA